MTDQRPPAFATWILKRAARGNEALIGDLLEEYRAGRSAAWYWRQTLTTVVVGRSPSVALALAVVVLFAAGSYFPLPGANAGMRELMQRQAIGTPWRLFSVLGGGQLSGVSIVALGIGPYVSAAFLVQAVALLWGLAKARVSRWRPLPIVACTWCVALVLCATQAAGLAAFLERVSMADAGLPIVTHPGWTFRVTTMLTLTASTVCLMLISDQISKRRLGNGMLLVFGAGVAAALPGILGPLLSGEVDPVALPAMLAINTTVVIVVAHGYRRAIERELTG